MADADFWYCYSFSGGAFMSTAAHTTKSPRQLYNIAKTLGVWDPAKIDLTEDKAHWQMLNPEQREQLIKTCALFYEGEVSVSDTLAWFMLAMPDLDRRMFLSTQIFEEVKHAEFFERYFQEVCGKVDTSAYLVPEYKGVLLDELRQRGEAIGQALTSGKGDLPLVLSLFACHYMAVAGREHSSPYGFRLYAQPARPRPRSHPADLLYKPQSAYA
jgi:hypothetical protein